MKVILFFTAVILALVSGPGLAAAETEKSLKQFTVGEFTVYAILDRDSVMKAEIFSGPLSEEQRLALMPGGQAPGSVNVFLIKGPAGNILVDAGWGRSGPGLGLLPERLKKIGLSPDDIDLVLLTHMHPDHIGGLLDGPDPAFPKAEILVSRPELEFWSGRAKPAKPAQPPSTPPDDLKPEPSPDSGDLADRPIAPGASADQTEDEAASPAKTPTAPDDLPVALINAYGPRLKTFEFDQAVSPGLTALKSVGHTPGHTAFLLESGQRRLLFIGDLIHAAALQFPEPEECASYDQDPVLAVGSRVERLQMAAERGLPVAGAHIPFPGIGGVKANGQKGFIFTPVINDLDKK